MSSENDAVETIEKRSKLKNQDADSTSFQRVVREKFHRNQRQKTMEVRNHVSRDPRKIKTEMETRLDLFSDRRPDVMNLKRENFHFIANKTLFSRLFYHWFHHHFFYWQRIKDVNCFTERFLRIFHRFILTFIFHRWVKRRSRTDTRIKQNVHRNQINEKNTEQRRTWMTQTITRRTDKSIDEMMKV